MFRSIQCIRDDGSPLRKMAPDGLLRVGDQEAIGSPLKEAEAVAVPRAGRGQPRIDR